MLVMMWVDCMSVALDSATEDEVKADNFSQAHGRVQPETKESRSQSRSSSFDDPTRHAQQ
jgi:hypothetical protein